MTSRQFHISDVLSITTGRLVSARHMDGIYDILSFLTGDSIYTHQIPRVMREVKPWLRQQYPLLFPENPPVKALLDGLTASLAEFPGDQTIIAGFVDAVRHQARFPEVVPEFLPVSELSAGMYTRIDPIEEAGAMVGDADVIVLDVEQLAAKGDEPHA